MREDVLSLCVVCVSVCLCMLLPICLIVFAINFASGCIIHYFHLVDLHWALLYRAKPRLCRSAHCNFSLLLLTGGGVRERKERMQKGEEKEAEGEE